MRSKLLIIFGILLVFSVVLAYFFLEVSVTHERQTEPVGVLAAKTDIPTGTVVRTIDDAQKLFHVITVQRSYVVPSAIKINLEAEEGNNNIIIRILDYFLQPVPLAAISDLEQMINKRIVRSFRRNEQIIKDYISVDYLDFDKETRLFALPTNFIDSVAGEVSQGSYIDVWIRRTQLNDVESIVTEGTYQPQTDRVQKLFGPLKVLSVKSSDNVHITDDAVGIPAAVIVSMRESDITVLTEEIINNSTIFLTKHER